MYKVLIIEDEGDTALAVQGALSLDKIESDIADNGEEGIIKFKSEDYDLILLDLKMPKMNGEEVLKSIRKINPFVDVIVYTNFDDYVDFKKLVNMGIDGYVKKGSEADLKQLVALIKEKLSPLDDADIETLLNNTSKDLFD